MLSVMRNSSSFKNFGNSYIWTSRGKELCARILKYSKVPHTITIQIISPTSAAQHLSVDDRKYNIILSRIKHRCSSLNADLFQVNKIPYPNCSCGVLCESTEHYCYLFVNSPVINKTFISYLYFDLCFMTLKTSSLILPIYYFQIWSLLLNLSQNM